MSTSRYERLRRALADARLEQGLTQFDVASRLSKPQSYVSKYETGERRLDVVEFLEVCEAMTIDADSILSKLQGPL